MDVFQFRDNLVNEYADYINSFINIADPRVDSIVTSKMREDGVFWPEPLVQMNPSYVSGGTIDDLVQKGVLHPDCKYLFRKNDRTIQLHQHQCDAIYAAQKSANYVLTTGTGSPDFIHEIARAPIK